MTPSARTPLFTIAAVATCSTPALAHHAMGGRLPSTGLEGLLSGLAHPVLGPDHLAFLIALGLAATFIPTGARAIAMFLATTVMGVLLHGTAWPLPMTEVMAAASVAMAGGLIAIGGHPRNGTWQTLAAAAGLVHGYAFGESIVGADPGVLGAYLSGLIVTSAAISVAAAAATQSLTARGSLAAPRLRTVGAALSGVGLVMLTLNLTNT